MSIKQFKPFKIIILAKRFVFTFLLLFVIVVCGDVVALVIAVIVRDFFSCFLIFTNSFKSIIELTII